MTLKDFRAWCARKAEEADREAAAHEEQLAQVPEDDAPTRLCKQERIARCDGMAVAFRAVEARLWKETS